MVLLTIWLHLTLNRFSVTFLPTVRPGNCKLRWEYSEDEGRTMKGRRSLSGGFFISWEGAQVFSLGSLPGSGQDPADSTALRLCSYSNVFCSPEQKLYCYTEHFMNLKSFIWNWSLNDFFYLPGLLAIPFKYPNENEEGLCCLSHFQVSMNYTAPGS